MRFRNKESGWFRGKILGKGSQGWDVAQAELVADSLNVENPLVSYPAFSPGVAVSVFADQRLGVAGVPVQQQPERHPG